MTSSLPDGSRTAPALEPTRRPAVVAGVDLHATRLPLPGTDNIRDLGGYPVDGGLIRPGRLFRAEALSHPGEVSVQATWDTAAEADYRAMGLRTVIDLRAGFEVERSPSAWGAATGAEVVALPIEEGGEGTDTAFVHLILSGEITTFGAQEMREFYAAMLERRAEVFVAGIRLLADPGRVPALVHCAAGKDRTGVFVALLLDALGAPRELVVEDYALTGEFRPDRVDAYREMLSDAGADPDAVRVLFETPAEAMALTLAALDAESGGAGGYLRAAGLTDDELEHVRTNLVRA